MSHFYPKSLRCVSSMHRPPPGTSNNSPAAVDVHTIRPSSLTVCILFMLPWLHHSSCYHCYATLHVTMVTPLFMLPWLHHSSCYHGYATLHVTIVTSLFMLPLLRHSSCYHCYATLHVTIVTPLFMLPLLRDSLVSFLTIFSLLNSICKYMYLYL
jgi:hypothetical protein